MSGADVRRALTYLAGFSVVQSAAFALSAVVATSLLGPHGRGVMVLGTTIASTVALLAGCGTGARLRSRLPEVNGAARDRLLSSYTWWSMLAAGGAGAFAALLSALSASIIDPDLAEPRFLFAVLVVTVGYVALTQFTETWFAVARFRTGSFWAAAMAASGLVAILVGALFARTPWVLLLAQGVGMVAMGAAQARGLHTARLLLFVRATPREMSELVRVSTPALGLTFGLAVILRTDRYVLGAVAGAGAVGVYSLVETLAELPRLLPGALSQVVMRQVAMGADLCGVARARRMAVLMAAGAGLAVAAGGWLLIGPLFGPAFAEARPVLLLLLLAEVVFAPFAVASRGLLGGGWMATAGALGIGGGVVGGALFVTAVPLWGGYGAALACIVLYGGPSLSSWTLLRQRLQSTAGRVPAASLDR